MRPTTRYRAAATAAVLAGAALAGCGGDDGETLQVYSGRHYGIETAFEQFTEETGVEVEFLTGNDAELRERIAAEGEDTEADVYITVDAGNLAAAAEQGLFQPIDSPVLDEAIPAELSDPDGLWYGLTLRARTIVYNPELIAEDVPDHVRGARRPEWDGRVCMRDSSNVYQQSLVASLIAEHGEEEATRIVQGWADNAEILTNDVLILESVADGICEVGLTNHYYLARELEENPDFTSSCQWANQDDRGAHVNISGGRRHQVRRQPRTRPGSSSSGSPPTVSSVLVDGNHEYPANPTCPPERLHHRASSAPTSCATN